MTDQIDILDAMGAVNANRTFGGGAWPLLTGVGKALLEEIEDNTGGVGLKQGRSLVMHSEEAEFKWDVFISHASEDKETFVGELAAELQKHHLRVWYDEFSLTVGDSLRQSIDKGLAQSRYGIVVLSPNFFAKHWPQVELNGLVAREHDGKKVILPVWLGVDADDVAKYSPVLVDRVAAKASDGMAKAVADLLAVINPAAPSEASVPERGNTLESPPPMTPQEAGILRYMERRGGSVSESALKNQFPHLQDGLMVPLNALLRHLYIERNRRNKRYYRITAVGEDALAAQRGSRTRRK